MDSVVPVQSAVKDHITGLLAPVRSAVKVDHFSDSVVSVQSAVKDHITGLLLQFYQL